MSAKGPKASSHIAHSRPILSATLPGTAGIKQLVALPIEVTDRSGFKSISVAWARLTYAPLAMALEIKTRQPTIRINSYIVSIT